MEVNPVIEVKGLNFSYNGAEKVLDNVSFELHKGEILGVLGPNGAGKTTLLKTLLGILKGTGMVRILGRNVASVSPKSLAKIIGYVPQEHHIVFPYKVIDYVIMGRAPHHGMFSVPSRKDYDKAYRVLDDLGLGSLADKTITEISGGQFQLVLIARTLVQEAKILLMDEPVSHLDISNAVKTMNLIRKLVEEKRILGAIVTLHDPLMASLYCDKILLLNKGRVEIYGSPREALIPDKLSQVYGVNFNIIRYNNKYILVPII